MVHGYNLHFVNNMRRGRLAVVSDVNPHAAPAVKKAREASLQVKGAKLFNLLPRGIRDIDSNNVDTFKTCLDHFLMTIPDQPTIPGFGRAAITNSLIDQVAMCSVK